MRTPLYGILGMLQLALSSEDAAEMKDFISHAISAGTVLNQVLVALSEWPPAPG